MSINKAMNWLSEQSDVVFIGQNIKYPQNHIYDSLLEVPDEKKLEFPVAENFQLGFSIGVALTGKTVISVFPRWDFLVLATDQLVNHLDKYQYLYKGNFYPRIIIRTAVGSKSPLNPGQQHCQDHTAAYQRLCPNIAFMRLPFGSDALMAYQEAYKLSEKKPVVVVELPKS